jgi:hypothetical protein
MVASKKSKRWTSAAAKRLLSLAGNPGTVEDAVRIVAGEAIRDIPHPPLHLDALAARLNVTGITYEEIPFSGELRPSNGGFTSPPLVAALPSLTNSRMQYLKRVGQIVRGLASNSNGCAIC